MRSEIPTADQAEIRFAEDLATALSRQGIRGAYAQKLSAEWREHYASLCQEMSPAEALARLGSPDELAAAAAQTRFAGKFWCDYPVIFGSLSALGLFMLTAAVVVLPILGIAQSTGNPGFGFVDAYVWSFNWLGAGMLILLAFWLSGRLSSPPRFRMALLSVFSVLTLTLSMDFNPPLSGPGSGSFMFGALAPDYGTAGQFLVWMLVMLRLGVFAYVIRSLRRRV